jgi:hypothetical protein
MGGTDVSGFDISQDPVVQLADSLVSGARLNLSSSINTLQGGVKQRCSGLFYPNTLILGKSNSDTVELTFNVGFGSGNHGPWSVLLYCFISNAESLPKQLDNPPA